MSTFDPIIEHRLSQAADRRKGLRFLRHAASLGGAILAVLLLLALAKVFAGLPAAAVILGMALLIPLGFAAFLLLAVVVAVSREERAGLAHAWEEAHAPLLDRLHTLVYLEGERESPTNDSYARRISSEAHAILAVEGIPAPYSASRPLAHLLGFLLLFLATILFYREYEPWRAPYVPPQIAAPAAPAEPPLELPPASVVEEETPWGEIRITRPGADLAVTPAEDVPIQIEAASNRPLKSVEWFTAVNGGPESPHALPAPEEPLFAAYRETIRPAALHLADWDVVTYHARATIEGGQSYRSDVYFVEVRPFRADLLEQTGGEESMLYDLLDDLTGLIERQQEVIRRTYREQVAKDGKPDLPAESRSALWKSEMELAGASEHLAARFQAALGDRGVSGPTQKLAEAATAFDVAADRLRDGGIDDALGRERDALARLVAARQRFQAALAAEAAALKELRDEKLTQQSIPADMTAKIAEFRDEARAAEEFVRKALDDQRGRARAASAKPPIRNLAPRQEALRDALEEFRKAHPRAFEQVGAECDAASRAMQESADALKKPGAPGGAAKAGAAADKLQALLDAMKRDAHARQLADAYRLKQELDAQAARFEDIEKDPGATSPQERDQSLDRAMKLARQLKQVAENPPTRDDFGPELRQALDDKVLNDFESQCSGLGKAGGKGAQSHAAKGVKEGLQKMARAFEKSAPKMFAGGPQGADPLKPSGQEALDRGLAQLEGLAEAEGQEGKEGDGKGRGKPSPADETKLRAEAMANLEAGVFGRFGHNERSVALVRMLRREIRERPEPIDARVIERLRRALEGRQVEVGGASDASENDAPKATHFDPARLPPAYRKAIEKYFEKLSERPREGK